MPSPPEHVLPYQPAEPRRPRARRRRRRARPARRAGRCRCPQARGAHRRGAAAHRAGASRCPAIVSSPIRSSTSFRCCASSSSTSSSWRAPSTTAGSPSASCARARPTTRLGARRRRVVSRRPLHAALLSQGGVRARDPVVGRFIPAIDRVLYAPQVPFATAYFYTLEDPDPLRDIAARVRQRVRAARRSTPSCAICSATRRSIRSLRARRSAGEPMRAAGRGAARRDRWTGSGAVARALSVRSTIASPTCSSERTTGAAIVTSRGGGEARRAIRRSSRSRCGARRQGPASPTQTLGRARARAHVRLRHGGAARRSSRSIRAAGWSRICPASNDDLRFDDRRPPRWKFIYNNFGGLVRFFPSLGLDLSLDFSLSRILDIKNSMRFVVYHTDADADRRLGSATRARFGRKITPARLDARRSPPRCRRRASIPRSARRSAPAATPARAIGAGVGWATTTGSSCGSRLRRSALGAVGRRRLTVLDTGAVLSQGTASAGWRADRAARRRARAGIASLARSPFGDFAIARQMLSAGGAGGLRGYAVDELLGRARVHRARRVAPHLRPRSSTSTSCTRSISAASAARLFAEAGWSPACESYARRLERASPPTSATRCASSPTGSA